MNIYEHCLLSVRKFGGKVDDYIPIHSFIDSSKYYRPHFTHRILLHHTFGVKLCVKHLGYECLPSGVLVRDVGFEHIKEDLSGKCPTLLDWYRGTRQDISFTEFKKLLYDTDFGVDYGISNIQDNFVQDSLSKLVFRERWMYTPDESELQWLKQLKETANG